VIKKININEKKGFINILLPRKKVDIRDKKTPGAFMLPGILLLITVVKLLYSQLDCLL
jgi:hypothetical protein